MKAVSLSPGHERPRGATVKAAAVDVDRVGVNAHSCQV